MRWIVVLLVVAIATAASAKEATGKGKAKTAGRAKTTAPASARKGAGGGATEAAAAAFPQFCEEWMGKLAQRERENVANIKWERSSAGVRGEYTGYSHEHSCITKTGTGAVPVGRVTYTETRYEKEGKDESEAAQSTPRAVETIEVTEIFRYSGGKWLY